MDDDVLKFRAYFAALLRRQDPDLDEATSLSQADSVIATLEEHGYTIGPFPAEGRR